MPVGADAVVAADVGACVGGAAVAERSWPGTQQACQVVHDRQHLLYPLAPSALLEPCQKQEQEQMCSRGREPSALVASREEARYWLSYCSYL